MTAPAQDALSVELAQLGGVNLKSQALIVTVLGAVSEELTATWGTDWGMSKHSQSLFMIVLAVIVGAHLVARSLHHVAVEKANGAVKTALIDAALTNGTVIAASSGAQLSGVVSKTQDQPVGITEGKITVGPPAAPVEPVPATQGQGDMPVIDATVAPSA